MEKTDSAMVVPLDAGWSDVGSWSALAGRAADATTQGNVVTTGDVHRRGRAAAVTCTRPAA